MNADLLHMAIYSISDVARRFGLTHRTLRFYDQQGLLEPQRKGKHRLYSDDDLQRLEVILQASAIGVGVGEMSLVVRRGEERYAICRLDVSPSAAAGLLTSARVRGGNGKLRSRDWRTFCEHDVSSDWLGQP